MPFLTDELVAEAKSRLGDFILWDSEVTGFGVRVTPAGSKTFVFQWRLGGRSGSLRRRRIGRYGEMGVSEARRLAGDARKAIEHHRSADPSPLAAAVQDREPPEQPTLIGASELENQLITYFEGRTNSRSKILAAATRIFIRGGYHSNFEVIAQEAGVTRPTIYRYFASKDELFREVIAAITAETIPVLVIDRQAEPRQALIEFGRAFRDVILDDRQIAVFRLAMTSNVSPDVYELASPLQQGRTTDVLVAYLKWGMKAGMFRKADASAAAESFMASILGFARTNRFLGLPHKTSQQVERYLEQTVDLFLGGLARPRSATESSED